MNQLISIIVPCFNEELVITETIFRLRSVINKINNFDFEVIFIDDGSSDNTCEILKETSINDNRFRSIVFARNFGHQIAVQAGLDLAMGDAVIIIDADLQDPPEIISEMILKWQEGFDVVYGTRKSREGESKFKLITASYFYKVLNKLSEVPIPLDTGDFRLISRSVVNVLSCMPEKNRFIRGMVSWVGFKQISLPYDRVKRFAGESKYPLRKMIKFASDGILSFSTKPLHISITLGVFSSFLSIVGIFYSLYMRLFTNTWIQGWTALMIAILFFGGVQLLCIGILGEYIGRIYNESKNRPLYIIKDYFGYSGIDKSKSRSPDLRNK